MCWLMGYSNSDLHGRIEAKTEFRTFFEQVPGLHPDASKITGLVCRHRAEGNADRLTRKIRHLEKRVDEFAKGRAMEKLLGGGCA